MSSKRNGLSSAYVDEIGTPKKAATCIKGLSKSDDTVSKSSRFALVFLAYLISSARLLYSVKYSYTPPIPSIRIF